MGFTFFTQRFVFERYQIYDGGADVWQAEPTQKGLIIYSVIIPILCFFGICGNGLSLMVLRRKELNGSVYTYLAVLAITDLISSVLLLMGGLCRGALFQDGWGSYDALILLPLGGAINFLGVCATVFVTIDRVIFLWDSTKVCKPKFCNPTLARRIMIGCFIISFLFNIPYCFIFDWDSSGTLVTTDFFDSIFYEIHNWICLILFCIIPSIILIIGNSFLIKSLNRANKLCNKLNCTKNKKKDHRSLTITLTLIIVIFLISEIPANLISRTSAVNILFHGDHDKANTKGVEITRQVCTIIGAISITINFVLYYLFCPPFCKVLVKIIYRGDRKISKTLQVNVFVLNGEGLKGDKRKCSYVMKENKVFRISSLNNILPSVVFEDTTTDNTNNTNRMDDDNKDTTVTNTRSIQNCSQ